MEDQLKDGQRQGRADQQPSIDPLRRVFVPIEKRTLNGTLVFKTHDKTIYARLDNGSIRRAVPKVNGKVARRLRRGKKV